MDKSAEAKNQDFESKPAYFDGKFVALKDANINIRTHALQYGTAFFGGLRAYYNEAKKNLYLFRLKDHHARLRTSAKILQFQWAMEYAEFEAITVQLLRDGAWRQNCYLRPFIYKSELSLSPRLHNVADKFALYAIPLNDYLDTTRGLKAQVSSWVRISDNQIPARAKATGGYLNSALAKSEALENGFDEAIFLDQRGMVCEGSAENIFIVRAGRLITPGAAASILEGITRRSVIAVATDLGIAIDERDISRTELYASDEIFFCGTGAQIAWVESVDRRTIGSGQIGPVTQKIRERFFKLAAGEMQEYKDWLTPVYT